MGYMLMLAALLTHLGRIECVKSASHFVLRMSIIFYLIAQHILTLGTIMPPFFVIILIMIIYRCASRC